MRSNHCSDHRYWPKEKKEQEQDGKGIMNEQQQKWSGRKYKIYNTLE